MYQCMIGNHCDMQDEQNMHQLTSNQFYFPDKNLILISDMMKPKNSSILIRQTEFKNEIEDLKKK